MTSGRATLDGSSMASSFKIPASDISIWGISGTLGLIVPGMFSSESLQLVRLVWCSQRVGSVSEVKPGVKTDCRWLLIRFALSVLDVWTSLVWGSQRGPIPCESWREFFQKKNGAKFD